MSPTRTLIVGTGYLGRRVGRLLRAQGDRVFGTTRSGSRADELAGWGIEAVVADVLDPRSLDGLPSVDRVFYCVGFDRSSGLPIRTVYVDGLRHALGRLIDRAPRLVYAGSTGVYGQDDGGWVVESSPTEPRTASGQACLEAEHVLREVGASRGLALTILRYSGLYGPGRIIRREALVRGDPIQGDPARWLNVIHIDDAARVAVAALDRGGPGSLFLASDDRPVPRSQFYEVAAECLEAPAPRFEPIPPGTARPSREDSNKRVSNRRMRDELGVTLTYPDITTGVPAAIHAGP